MTPVSTKIDKESLSEKTSKFTKEEPIEAEPRLPQIAKNQT